MASMAAIAVTTDLRPSDIRLKLAIAYSLAEMGLQIPAPVKAGAGSKGKRKTVSPLVVFGVPLASLVETTGVKFGQLKVPALVKTVHDMLQDQLHTEGLFRISANAIDLRAMKIAANEGRAIDGDVHDVVGLLKSFLRELPDPLLTFRLYEEFIEIGKMNDPKSQATAVRLMCLELPTENLHTLVVLCSLLAATAAADGNKMQAHTLATVMAPNLLRPVPAPVPRKRNSKRGKEQEQAAMAAEFVNHGYACKVVEIMITQHNSLGTTPSHTLSMASKFTAAEAKRLYPQVTKKGGRNTGSWWWPFGSGAGESTGRSPSKAGSKHRRAKSERSQTKVTRSSKKAKLRPMSSTGIPEITQLGGTSGMHELARLSIKSPSATAAPLRRETPMGFPDTASASASARSSVTGFDSPIGDGFSSDVSDPNSPTLRSPTGSTSGMALTGDARLRVTDRGANLALPTDSDNEFEGFGDNSFMEY